MTVKLLSLCLLSVAGLGLVQAGKSASWRPIRRARWLIDGVREIVPFILDQRQVTTTTDTAQETTSVKGLTPDTTIHSTVFTTITLDNASATNTAAVKRASMSPDSPS
jgi:hypothetical protein